MFVMKAVWSQPVRVHADHDPERAEQGQHERDPGQRQLERGVLDGTPVSGTGDGEQAGADCQRAHGATDVEARG